MDIAGIETSMDGFSRTHVRVEMVGLASTGILTTYTYRGDDSTLEEECDIVSHWQSVSHRPASA